MRWWHLKNHTYNYYDVFSKVSSFQRQNFTLKLTYINITSNSLISFFPSTQNTKHNIQKRRDINNTGNMFVLFSPSFHLYQQTTSSFLLEYSLTNPSLLPSRYVVLITVRRETTQSCEVNEAKNNLKRRLQQNNKKGDHNNSTYLFCACHPNSTCEEERKIN